ncbi:MAG: hypothetical protein JW798_17775 [Prolixibacteraceae bacterium]|nr:hypothetical protein [Prolixibacteraceae bacterium]
MMYLVLTAMLALNVAAETLKAFKIIDTSLMRSYDNFSTSNKDFVNDYFREAYLKDPTKARDMLELAEIVQEETDSLVNYIFKIKEQLVLGAGGYEKLPDEKLSSEVSLINIEQITTINNTLNNDGTDIIESPKTKIVTDTLVLKRQDDLNISPELMLTKGIGKKLQDSILNYRDFVSSFYRLSKDSIAKYRDLLTAPENKEGHLLIDKILENESILTGAYDAQKIKIVNEALDVEDPERSGIDTDASLNYRTWAEENFEASPVIASISLLSKLQTDIRNAEAALLRHLFYKIWEFDIKITNLKAKYIPNSNYIFQGDEYKARIFLSAEDSSLKPSVYINGRKADLPLVNNEFIFSYRANNPGPVSFKGEIRYPFPGSNDSISDFFTMDFEVAPPQYTVSPTKMNVLYKDVPGGNPISISVPAVPINRIRPTMINGRIEPDPDILHSWLAYPTGNAGIDTATIIVNVDIDGNGQLRRMGEMDFRIKNVPSPVTVVAGRSSGTISLIILRTASGVEAKMEEFEFDLQWEISKFDMTVISSGYASTFHSTSNRFTEQQRTILNNLGTGDRLLIENVRGRIRSAPGRPLKPERPLSSVILTIN